MSTARTARTAIRIIGIDPGSRTTGYGVIDFLANRSVHVASGCIRIDAATLAEKLHIIYDRVGGLVDTESPTEMAVEKVFVSRNPASALKLGHARGAALLAGVVRGLPVHEYSPNEIKQSITGRGHADKGQVQHMVRVLLNLAETPAADAADALAVAVCHAHVRETRQRLAESIAPEIAGLRVAGRRR